MAKLIIIFIFFLGCSNILNPEYLGINGIWSLNFYAGYDTVRITEKQDGIEWDFLDTMKILFKGEYKDGSFSGRWNHLEMSLPITMHCWINTRTIFGNLNKN